MAQRSTRSERGLDSGLPQVGTRIRFRGGTGRNDEPLIHEGIVNGEPQHYRREQLVYIPVHLQKSNQNVLVEWHNIVQSMATFVCNPDESAGYSEKVCRYVVYECWERPPKIWYKGLYVCPDCYSADGHAEDCVACVEIAECDGKSAIGTMLVQLADDRAEIDSPAKVMALWDRLEERWITGTP